MEKNEVFLLLGRERDAEGDSAASGSLSDESDGVQSIIDSDENS